MADTERACQYCGKTNKNSTGNAAHERFCHKNPERANNLRATRKSRTKNQPTATTNGTATIKKMPATIAFDVIAQLDDHKILLRFPGTNEYFVAEKVTL